MKRQMNKKVLSLFAHPDDAEFSCAGTLALLNQSRWDIHIATMTSGDCGTTKLSSEEISRIRRQEAAGSAEILKGTFHCLECDDMFIMYDRPTLLKVIEILRKIKPAIVFTHSPADYLTDHENTSRLVWTGCFSAGMRNIEIAGTKPFETVPYLYYADPFEGKDKFGTEIKPSVLIDITTVIDIKEKMLCCHKSQRNWLLEHHGMDEYVESMKRFCRLRGRIINKDYAEGFRQHLGHGFGQDNILKRQLPGRVYQK